MDESQVSGLNADLQDCDEVLLSDRAFDTDPSAILIESSDLHKLRFRLIEWLAQSPNRKVKTARKQAIAKTLAISTRQVERLLNQYNEDRLRETAGVERSDKGDHRILHICTTSAPNSHLSSAGDSHSTSAGLTIA
ncbi:hypothetical protein [Leptolyngbya sp. FACHB-17]|uniref:hypothetical protein n=1 Tax=unclassified Leptolyngbya TaxID=2650499 RepID=UPI00168043C5|nr:hypothetical protein [Leptolyngbya sp. FACHB-17]MBD2080201.1 hypothetical protein [Leptolyngbya sp. FACHB-17]